MVKRRIEVSVKIVDCEEPSGDGVEKRDDGIFQMTIDEADAISIDRSEQAVLATCYPAIRDAVAKHLSELSKKKRENDEKK